jgi:hypothetical protein
MTQKLCVSCAVAALTLALSSHLTLPLWADGSPSPSAPANLSVYHSPKGSTIYAGGTQATCTVTLDMTNHVVSKVTLAKGSEGYTGVPLCTISGGGGSGATCKAVITPTIGARPISRRSAPRQAGTWPQASAASMPITWCSTLPGSKRSNLRVLVLVSVSPFFGVALE